MEERVLQLASELGVLRPRDLKAHGIARTYLQRLYERGLLDHPARGLYTLPDAQAGEHRMLAEASKRVPRGVVCLLSALRFHDITTQAPFEVWLALPNEARTPRVDYPPLRIVRMSGEALTAGIETHHVDGVDVMVYALAKTVADCFKFRNKIGLDVALEALREAWLERRVSMDELWHYAEICRVANVMRPYLESLA